ncbi:MAG: hypothetical protein WCC06_00810 [Candidatus Aminicenantales bacterium]
MPITYSIETIRKLEEIFLAQKVLRPLRLLRYESGTVLEYEVKGVWPVWAGRARLEIEKFVGGGYAGQVYKARLLDVAVYKGTNTELKTGNSYALKILIPATGFGRWFRNFIYALGFQGPFSLQSNPTAARAGALWQKFIRRGAKIRLGSENAVVDIYATFIDPRLGSCGEVSEWVDGRTWRFEVDDDLDARMKWKAGSTEERLGSPEFRTKYAFMADCVRLMHEMGALELARQYEWWTLKSQPNALKRLASDPDPKKGLVAVDFRPGLALLPFIPMCPADFRLILKGIGRGSLVQFDRGKWEALEGFVHRHAPDFSEMTDALEELKQAENNYRRSLPDIAHHPLQLIFSQKLRSSIMRSQRESWRIRNLTDEKTQRRLEKNGFLAFIFYFLGIIPLLGKFLRKLWGRTDYRRHFGRMWTSLDYFKRAGRARIAETLIRWHRSGRVTSARALKIARSPVKFFAHFPLSLLPPSLHHFLTDWKYVRERLDYIFVRPFRLYFNARAREEWLLDMVSQGEANGLLSREEAGRIQSQVKEPFIQKYLKSLAVHVCTLPVTQIVSITIAIIYVRLHPEFSWQQASVAAGIILGLFQVIPISPGSLVRGLYTTFLVLRERNFKDYSIAFSLSYFKYIGYLAFPIQMTYRYPDLARFMAGHWATGAVHIIPVFGEKGAWLEHFAFDVFYNYPLTIRRRIRRRREARAALKPRFWHWPFWILAGTGVLALMDIIYFKVAAKSPGLGRFWWAAIWVPFVAAAAFTTGAGGTTLAKRIAWGILCGVFIGLLYAAFNTFFVSFVIEENSAGLSLGSSLGIFGVKSLWQMFLFALTAAIGVFFAETRPIKLTEK